MNKKITQLFILVFVFATSSLFAQTFNQPVEYLEFVSNEQEQITKEMWRYTKALVHGRSDRNIENRRKRLVGSIEDAIKKIEKTEPYNDENTYKNDVVQNLTLNKNLLENEYSKIVDMQKVAEQSYDLMEAYIVAREMADEKMEDAQKAYEKSFMDYANKHKINIINDETDLGKKMKISSEVFEYYNDLYLIFFKVQINEVYLLNAMENNDIGGIQQSANALKSEAELGLKKLDTIAVFKNDKSLIDATRKGFEFYIDEAENKVPAIIDFLVLNKDFETIKTNLEQTPEKKRTKEQVDAYNKKVNEINKGVNDYNKANADLNRKRSQVIQGLNQTNEKFLAKHIPND